MNRPRKRRSLLVGLVATAACAAIAAVAPPAVAQAPPSILPFLAAAGGQEVVVPNGVYSGGAIAAPHDGWLVLRAETPGGVVLDLSQTGLQLDDGTSRIVFVGFRFVNGMVRLAGVHDIHFWYCDFTFPAEEWLRQYQAAGGRAPADRRVRDQFASRMANPLPTGVRMRQGVYDTALENERIGFWGSDFHDIADDGIFFARASTVHIGGLRMWTIDERHVDPGRALGDVQDWFHNDAIQTIGGIRDVTVTDSWIGQKVQWGAEGRSIEHATFRRLWFAGSTTYGQINEIKNGGRILGNTQEDIRAFANGQRNGPNFDHLWTDFADGVQRASEGSAAHLSIRGWFEMTTDRVTFGPPPGVDMRNGRLTNIGQVRDHRDNPANRWRATNPYESWPLVLRWAAGVTVG